MNLQRLAFRQLFKIRPPGVSTSQSSCVLPQDRRYSTETRTTEHLRVLYDGACPLCLKEINLLQRLNKKKNRLHFVDISSPDYSPAENGNISYDRAMQAMHVIGADGQVYTRVPAFRQMYGAVGFGWVTSFTKIPGLDRVLDHMYTWFARNRLKWTNRECEAGTCAVKYPKKSKP